MVPAPDIVFEAPFIVTLPLLAVNEPEEMKFPVMIKEAAVVTVPLIVRFENTISAPLIVLEVPDIVIVPPLRCVN